VKEIAKILARRRRARELAVTMTGVSLVMLPQPSATFLAPLRGARRANTSP